MKDGRYSTELMHTQLNAVDMKNIKQFDII